jgi:hypothetical protein
MAGLWRVGGLEAIVLGVLELALSESDGAVAVG